MFCKELWLYLVYLLLRPSNAQIKTCYALDEGVAPDFPCDPEADVSACCGGGWICRTNLNCENIDGFKFPGTCTNRSWVSSHDPSCPFALNFGKADPFNYQLNTTVCSDGTICPNYFFSASNTTCCDKHQGIHEINYHNNAFVPDAASDLPEYYSSANFTIPTDGIYKTASYSDFTATTSSSSITHVATPTLSPSTAPLSERTVSPALSPSTAPSSERTVSPATSSTLSSGTKAHIGVGAAVGAFAIAGLATLFWMRRRKTLRKSTDMRTVFRGESNEGASSNYVPTARQGYKGELHDDYRRELAVEHTRELPAEHMRELPAQYTRELPAEMSARQ